MEKGGKIIVSGYGESGIAYLENTGIINDIAVSSEYPIKVEFYDGTIDAFKRDSIRLYDYR